MQAQQASGDEGPHTHTHSTCNRPRTTNCSLQHKQQQTERPVGTGASVHVPLQVPGDREPHTVLRTEDYPATRASLLCTKTGVHASADRGILLQTLSCNVPNQHGMHLKRGGIGARTQKQSSTESLATKEPACTKLTESRKQRCMQFWTEAFGARTHAHTLATNT